ncbi:hypothetical protein [Peredibacter starrii]|uniref:Cytochrome c domain-containing protein n=1 Tax=Peredibacter starrii TaxID=28202 RepID=A0AAX4HJI8_9BACT|nr:hypothetical protein [Peredibacter starrii]WPU63375.1 hypothetical protein SOO65_11825 [Peredibacter starrii]
MNFNIFKLAVIFLLGTILAVYTNCGKPGELMFESGYHSSGSEASYESFQKSVYSITRSNCISCHSTIQPMHASDDYREAHDILVSQKKVNFENISASRIVAKLRGENHNCWSDCEANAQAMERAIESWKAARDVSGEVDNEGPSDLAIYTSETDTLEMEFVDAGNAPSSNTVKINVEAAMRQAPMVLVNSGDGPYLTVENNLNNTLANNDQNAGLAFMNFKVPTSGAYRIWGLVQGPTDQDNSFFMTVRDTKRPTSVLLSTRNVEFPAGSRFEWRQLNVSMNLVAGTEYTLELRQREDGARAQAFVVTSDPAFNGQEVNDFFGITLSFDLSPRIPNGSFKIDIVDYDLYSYKLTKPRIVAPSNVKVKNIKLFINGAYSPQHSAYTLVNKITSASDNLLSKYAMIVIKDKGLSGDRFKFSFEEIYPTDATGTTTGGTGGGTETQTSLMAYQGTVYPISRSSAYSCVGCHMSTSPRHASDNAQTAHDATLGVVDFNTPSNSRIVRKMRTERHNCGANCDSIATQYENAIIEWRNRLE